MTKTRSALKAVTTAMALTALAALAPQPALGQEGPEPPREYVVRSGDTLFGISRRFQTTVEAIKESNRLSGDGIQVGQRLLIPPSVADEALLLVPVAPDTAVVEVLPLADSTVTPALAADSTDESSRPTSEVDSTGSGPVLGLIDVQPGQSLYDISLATGLSMDSLLALNPDVRTFLADTARLVVPVAYASQRYVVRPGDTLFKIARASGTTVAAIRASNALSGDIIHVGQVLTVPSTRVAGPAASVESLPLVGEGEARVYPERFAGRLTASGRAYDPEQLTISHRDLPIGSIVLVTRSGSDRKTFAEVTDRLPGSAGYLVDASQAAFRALGPTTEGNLDVEIRVVRFGPHTN